MNLEKIKRANTKYLGKNILYFEEIESTQDYAKELTKNKEKIVPNGSMVLCNHQTRGRGTKDRRWLTTKGKNITMTLILYPNTKVSNLESLTLDIAKAIKQAIYKLYNYNLTIKEPNDLLLNGKKISGILTESKILNGIVTNLYIGIGFNVNEETFSDDIKETATSLKKEYGRKFEKEEIICKILEEIDLIGDGSQ